MKKLYIVALTGLIFFLASCSAPNIKPKDKEMYDKSEKILFSTKQARKINLNQLVKETEDYPVIFVGDHHNTEKTHEFFNSYLQALADKGYALHLANEWFAPKHNKLLQLYINGNISSEELKQKRDLKRIRWDLVEKLYATVKNSGGKLYGVNLSKEDRRKISKRLFEQMSKEERSFYDNLDLNVSAHRKLVMPFFGHCKKMFKYKKGEPCDDRMYRVQVAWDTYMAEQSAKIAKKVIRNKKDKLIVFAGAMHMEYGLGIPLRFSRISNLPSYIISNEINSNEDINRHKADALFLYDR